jgi:hypothetical protein
LNAEKGREREKGKIMPQSTNTTIILILNGALNFLSVSVAF